MNALRQGATLRFEAMLPAALKAAAHAHQGEAFGLCVVQLADQDGRRFAAALHQADPQGPDPTRLTKRRPALRWCRSASLEVLAPVVAAVLGAELRTAVKEAHAAGAVPVVHIAAGVAVVGAFSVPGWPS